MKCKKLQKEGTRPLTGEQVAAERERLLQGARKIMEFAKMDPQNVTLEDVFCSDEHWGDQNLENIRRLREEVAKGLVTMEIVDDIPPLTVENASDLPSIFHGRDQHVCLCYRAALWMMLREMKWVPESPYAGGRADVKATETPFAVECGYTTSEKVIRALECGWTVMVLPYCSDTKDGHTLAFIFRPNGIKPPDPWINNATRGVTDADF